MKKGRFPARTGPSCHSTLRPQSTLENVCYRTKACQRYISPPSGRQD